MPRYATGAPAVCTAGAQLFALAASVMRSCDAALLDDLARVTTTSAHSTTVKLSCEQGTQATCCVCQLPARGLYVWCQGCGHGGHVECMRGWFAHEIECPAGCGHRCQLRVT